MLTKRQRFGIVAVILLVIQIPTVAFLLGSEMEEKLGVVRYGLVGLEVVLTVGILGFAWILLKRKGG